MKLIIDNLAISSKHQSKNNIMPRRSGRGSEATSSSSSSSKKKVKSESPANADRNTIHSNKNDKNGNDESGSDEEEVEPPYNHLVSSLLICLILLTSYECFHTQFQFFFLLACEYI